MNEIVLLMLLAFLAFIFLFSQWITHKHKYIEDRESRVPQKYSKAIEFIDQQRESWHYIVDPKKNLDTLKKMIKNGDVPV